MSRSYWPIRSKSIDCMGPAEDFSTPIEAEAEIGDLYRAYYTVSVNCDSRDRDSGICGDTGEKCPHYTSTDRELREKFFPEINPTTRAYDGSDD